MPIKYLSLFSGIEAASVAWHPLGWQCVAVAEIEPFPCAVLAHHYPAVPNLGDVTSVTEEQIAALGPIDLVVFGSPCQDLSVAGKRAGLAGERSGLFHTAIRIIEIARRRNGARFALWENVPGAFSSNAGRDFAAVVGSLAGMADVDVPPKGWGNEGCAVGEEGMVEWATLDAQWFGVAQRRRRVFALADFGDWAGRPPILLERESLRGDSAPRREAGEGTAGCLEARTRGGGFPGTDGAAGHVVGVDGGGSARGVKWPADVASTLNAAFGEKQGLEDQHALTAKGPAAMGAPEVDAGHYIMSSGQANASITRGAPIVAIQNATRGKDQNGLGISEAGDPMYTLDGASQHAIAFAQNQRDEEQNGARELMGTLKARREGGGFEAAVAVCIKGAAIGRKPEAGPQYGETLEEVAYTQNCVDIHGVMTPSMQVRRLTPRECERLQGFPDDYTLIPHRGKPAADGPRYKALGNSMAVPVMRWIGRKIHAAWMVS